MRKMILLVMLVLMVVSVGSVWAQEGSDPGDNWCFDGGPLAGRCTTDDPAQTSWYWLYGFYRAQIAKGTLSVNDIPQEYRIGFGTLSTGNSSGNAVVLDANGNPITPASDFQGTISTCKKGDSTTLLEVIWVGLEIAGDRIEISTEEGSVSANRYIPTTGVDVRFRLNDPVDKITPGGKMRVYYRGALIGESDLAGLNACSTE